MSKVVKYSNLIEQIRSLVKTSQNKLVQSINTTVTLTYWQIGQYIVEFEQNGN